MKDFGSRALFHHFTLSQHHDPVGDVGDNADIMRDEQHAHAAFALQLTDQVEDLALRRHVKRGGRLIRDQQSRVIRQCHGDHDALALPPRKLERKRPGQPGRIGQADLFEQLFDTRGNLCLWQSGRVDPDRFGDLCTHLLEGVQRGERLLEDHRDPGAAQAAHSLRASG